MNSLFLLRKLKNICLFYFKEDVCVMFGCKRTYLTQPFLCPSSSVSEYKGALRVLLGAGKAPIFAGARPETVLSSLTPFFLSCNRSNWSGNPIDSAFKMCLDPSHFPRLRCYPCDLSHQHLSPGLSQLPPKWSSCFCPCSLPSICKIITRVSWKTTATLRRFPCKPFHQKN